jgi:hypothetical protein
MIKSGCMALASAFIFGALLAGCGGSGSSGPLTKAEFVQQAKSICQDAEAEQGEALRAADGASGLAELTLDALSPVQDMAEELAELSPPPGDAKKTAAIIEAVEAGVAEVKADPVAATAAIGAFAEANKLAEAYGLTGCVI